MLEHSPHAPDRSAIADHALSVTRLTSHGSLTTTTIVQHRNPIATHRPPIAATNDHPGCPKPAPTPLPRAVATPASLRPCPRRRARGQTRPPARRPQSVPNRIRRTTNPTERKPRGEGRERRARNKRNGKAGRGRRHGECKPTPSALLSTHRFVRKTSDVKASEDAAALAAAETKK